MNHSKDLKNKTISGVVWKGLERVAAQFVSAVVGIVLARILIPEDYSVVSIITIFFTFCNIFISGGLNTALIQKKCQGHLPHNVCQSSLAAKSCLLWSKTIRIKSNVLGQEFVDDPDQFPGAMSKSGVMATALGTLQVVVFPEGLIALYDIMC